MNKLKRIFRNLYWDLKDKLSRKTSHVVWITIPEMPLDNQYHEYKASLDNFITHESRNGLHKTVTFNYKAELIDNNE